MAVFTRVCSLAEMVEKRSAWLRKMMLMPGIRSVLSREHLRGATVQ